MNQLEQAIMLATKYHAGQVDKGGNPYILHPLSVMQKVKTIEEKIVALFHDILEDTPATKTDLLNYGYSKEIVLAVVALTRLQGESYGQFIRRLHENPLALSVKIADLTDNMDLSRIESPTESDYARVIKYAKVLKRINEGFYVKSDHTE